MEQQLNASEATSLAHNTLSSQITALISITSGSVKAQIESLRSILDSNMVMINEAAIAGVDENNTLIELLEARDKEISNLKIKLSQSEADVRQMLAARRDDEQKVKAIEIKHHQVLNQRDNYKKDAEAAGALKAENKRLKNQVERTKEASDKLEARLNQAEQTIHGLRAKLLPTHEAVRGCVDMMRFIRQTLIFEGLAPEHSIDCNGETYHIYRRPADVAKAFSPMMGDKQVSRQHMFFFRVETNGGYHFDAIPMETGEAAVAKHKAVPAAVKKHLIEQFDAETTYDYETLKMRNDDFTEQLAEIERTLPALESLNAGMKSQLIGNKVITASRVNTNKNKRRAA